MEKRLKSFVGWGRHRVVICCANDVAVEELVVRAKEDLLWVALRFDLLFLWNVGDDGNVGSYAWEVGNKAKAGYVLF